MVPLSAQPPPGPTVPQARDRRPLASSPGGGRHDLRSAQRGPWRSALTTCRCGTADFRPVLPVGAGTRGSEGRETHVPDQPRAREPLLRRAGPLRSHPRSRRATPCPPPSPAPARVVPRRQRRNPLDDVGLAAPRYPNQLPVVRRAGNDLDRIPRHPQQLREESDQAAVRLAPLGGWRDVGADLPARKPSDPLRGGAGSGPRPAAPRPRANPCPSRRNLRAAQGVHGERGRRKCRTLGQVTHDFSTAAREVRRNGPEFRPYVSGGPRVLRAPDPRRRKSHV